MSTSMRKEEGKLNEKAQELNCEKLGSRWWRKLCNFLSDSKLNRILRR